MERAVRQQSLDGFAQQRSVFSTRLLGVGPVCRPQLSRFAWLTFKQVRFGNHSPKALDNPASVLFPIGSDKQHPPRPVPCGRDRAEMSSPRLESFSAQLAVGLLDPVGFEA